MNRKILTKKNTAPLIILFVSVVLLICMTFPILTLMRHIVLGMFGVNAYIILLLIVAGCVAKIVDYKNRLSNLYTISLAIIALSILFIVHLTMTDSTYHKSFTDCMEYPFAELTPAGAFFSLILLPFRLLLPLEAVICIFVVLIVVFLCICIDLQYHNKHLKFEFVKSNNNSSTKTEKLEKQKGAKAQTMRIPNATMEKNKNMPTFISMPLTLNAKITKEEKEKNSDLVIPQQPRTINLPKQEKVQSKNVDASIYSGIINADVYKSSNNSITIEQMQENSEMQPLKPQKFVFDENEDVGFIGKPQTILKEKATNEFNNLDFSQHEDFDNNDFPLSNENTESNIDNKVDALDKLGLSKSEDFIIKDDNTIDSINIDTSQNTTRNDFNITKNEFNTTNEIKKEMPKPKKKMKYIRPPLDLLTTQSTTPLISQEKFEEKARIIEEKFEEFKISVKCVGVTRGPAITRYEFEMPQGVTVNKVLQYSNDISMVLEARKAIRIEAPIPGKNAFGIEVPNDKVDTVGLRDIIDTKEFRDNPSPLTFALGKDITNKPVLSDVGKLVHTLVAGSTGSGKSVCMNSIIISLLYKASPSDVRIILIDPKFVEFNIYENLPHLLLPKIITEPAQAVNALSWACEEMERRNRIFGQHYVRSIDEYNDMPEVKDGTIDKMYKIVIMVDELADLMLNTRKEIEEKILKLSQKARSSGIHLILATQRPSVDIITGTIKANLPSRIAFSLTNFNDSKTIIDQSGAEKLLGRGDMLYCPRGEEPTRLLGPFISQQEVASIVRFIKENNVCDYDPSIEEAIMVEKNNEVVMGDGADASKDEYYKLVLRNVIETQMCSISSIQRRFNIGYNRAARIVDDFVSKNYISKADGTKPRQIYITMEEFLNLYGDKN